MSDCECSGGRHSVREGHRGYAEQGSPESLLLPRFDAHQFVPGDRINYFQQGAADTGYGQEG
jgi:hypothetical protein